MKSKMHWIYQLLLALGQGVNLYGHLVPAKYQPLVAAVLGLSQGGLGLYNHYFAPDGSKLPVIILLLMLTMGISGCKDPYGASSKAGADIATGIAQGMVTVQRLQQNGTISATEALNVAGYLEFANKGDEAFLSCVSAAHTSGSKAGTFTACAQTFNATLNNPQQLALIKVGNSSAQQEINTIVNAVTTGVNAVVTALGGA